MFGYIRPQKSEMLVREYEQYKAVYCSLCRQLGKSYGMMARLTLSYDCTFYALVQIAVGADCPGFKNGRCVVNPLKKCAYCNAGENELIAASALSVIMTYYKIKDDIADSRFWGKLRSALLLPFAARAHKRAARDFPWMDAIVSKSIQMQYETEHRDNPCIDACAEPTSEMLRRVFESIAGEPEDSESAKARVLRQFGYYLGRWVYLIDAADDIEKDIRFASFNPFVLKFQLNESSTQEELEKVRDYVNRVLNLTLSQLIAALNIMDLNCFGPIIDNVVKKGLPQIQKEILFKKEKMHVGSL